MASSSPSLKKFLYLSIAAAVVTIGLKSSAYLLTGSVGLLSDALESGIQYHSLLTRQSGQRKFIALHILVPGTWTVQQGHNALEKIESDIRKHFQGPVTVFTHLEPIKDPLSMDDIGIERVERE